MYYFSAEEIKNLFLIDPVEFQDGLSVEDVYTKKLKEAKKMGNNGLLVGRSYGYKSFTLFQSIKMYWILEPIEIDISKRLIHDGLHRIACAYAIDKHRPILVNYV